MDITTFEKILDSVINSSISSIEFRFKEIVDEVKECDLFTNMNEILSLVIMTSFTTTMEELGDLLSLNDFVNVIYEIIQDNIETEYIFEYSPLYVLHQPNSDTFEEKFHVLIKYIYTKVLLGTNWDIAMSNNNSNVIQVDFRKRESEDN